MSGSAVGDTLGYFTGNAEQAAQQRTGDIAENTGDDDHSGGDGDQTTIHLGQWSANGRSDGFGQQRHDQRLVIAQKQTPNCYKYQAGHRTGYNTGQNGRQILFQHGKVLF